MCFWCVCFFVRCCDLKEGSKFRLLERVFVGRVESTGDSRLSWLAGSQLFVCFQRRTFVVVVVVVHVV